MLVKLIALRRAYRTALEAAGHHHGDPKVEELRGQILEALNELDEDMGAFVDDDVAAWAAKAGLDIKDEEDEEDDEYEDNGEWRQEFAMQQGMAFGAGAYNEARGCDHTPPDEDM